MTRGQYFHFWKNNISVVNGIFCQDKMLDASLSPTKKPPVPVDILSNRYLKNTLRIDYKQRLPCFYQHYGANLEYLSALS